MCQGPCSGLRRPGGCVVPAHPAGNLLPAGPDALVLVRGCTRAGGRGRRRARAGAPRADHCWTWPGGRRHHPASHDRRRGRPRRQATTLLPASWPGGSSAAPPLVRRLRHMAAGDHRRRAGPAPGRPAHRHGEAVVDALEGPHPHRETPPHTVPSGGRSSGSARRWRPVGSSLRTRRSAPRPVHVHRAGSPAGPRGPDQRNVLRRSRPCRAARRRRHAGPRRTCRTEARPAPEFRRSVHGILSRAAIRSRPQPRCRCAVACTLTARRWWPAPTRRPDAAPPAPVRTRRNRPPEERRASAASPPAAHP